MSAFPNVWYFCFGLSIGATSTSLFVHLYFGV